MYTGGNSDPAHAPGLAYPGACARERWLYDKSTTGSCTPDTTGRFLTLVGGQPGGNGSSHNPGGSRDPGPPPARNPGETDPAYRARMAAHVTPLIADTALSDSYALGYDHQWITQGAAVGLDRTIAYMIPMSYKSYIPRATPTTVAENERWAMAANLAQGADPNGAWKPKYQQLAADLVANGIYTPKLRLGWEMDGIWFAWQYAGGEPYGTAAYTTNAANWRAFFRNIHQWMTDAAAAKATQLGLNPAAINLEFVWNPDVGGADPTGAPAVVQYHTEDAWPGDDVVDTIALEAYCNTPNTASPPQSTCFNHLKTADGRGLDYYTTYAQTHHNKPLALAEWTLDHNAGDDANYITQTFNWIKTHNVVWVNQFDATDTTNNWRLCPTPYCNPGTQFPNASTTFKTLFTQNLCNNNGTPTNTNQRTWTCRDPAP
jgi:hypothetical protein